MLFRSVYFMLFAEEGIGFLSGPAYAPAAVSMRLIMPTIIFIGLSNILGMQILVPTGRERKVLQAVIAGSVIDLIINLLLIPALGSCGATIGTLVAEFAVALVEAVVLWQFLKEIWHMKRMVPYVAALIPSVAGAVALEQAGLLSSPGGQPLCGRLFPLLYLI